LKTAIVTDSNSGIFPNEGRELDIFIQPMPVILDEKEYFEGVNLEHRDFFRMLQEGADASTSQPAPGDVEELFHRVLGAGFDELVYIPMSSGLSASCQTAQMLAQDFNGKVQVVDNHRISVTQRDSVMDAKRMCEQGASAAEIKAALEAAAMDSLIYLGVDTLKYFKKNGRCTPATALLGSVFNIKPILKCDGERFDAVAKVRGLAAAQKKLLETAQAAADKLRPEGGRLSVGAAGSFVDPEAEQAWAQLVHEAFPNDNFRYQPLSFSIVCHTGPNAFGMGFSKEM